MNNEEEQARRSRRSFLVRSGLLGAIAAVSPSLLLYARPARALHEGTLDWTVEQLIKALNALSEDTFKGLAAFIVPGNDAHSQAQGVAAPTPGLVAAKADVYIARALDRAVALPQPQMLLSLDALGSELALTPLTVIDQPDDAIGPVEKWILENLDDTIDEFLANWPIRGSTVYALILNLVAVRVNPLALNGLLLAPFSRLTWDEKARVHADLEAPDPTLVAAMQRHLPEPLHSTVPAALPLLANGAINLGAFGGYNEWFVFDPETRTLTARPLGWTLSNYQPDGPPPVEGWDEFLGYYQNRRKVS